MKDIIALIVFLSLTFFFIYLAVEKRIGVGLTIVFLTFAILSGLSISNSDIVKRLKWKGLEIETFERQVEQVKNDAIESIKNEVANLTKKAEDAKAQIESLNHASNELALLLTKITWMQLETKSEFGTKRVQVAVQQIFEDLNKVLEVIIPKSQERQKWIEELRKLLPVRKG